MQFSVRIVIEGFDGQSPEDLQEALVNLIHELDSFSLINIEVDEEDS